MAHTSFGPILRQLRAVVAPAVEQRSDRELLHAFTARQDEASFTALVRRHGPMVLRVCRRVLGHEQDAEDACQAAFLVLAKKAASLRKEASLASFLHGVAYRLSLSARRDAARRRKHEVQAPPRAPREADPAWREVQEFIEEEIERLPEKYRTAFLLCYLQGLSRAEAARALGVKEGTVWSRLSHARRRLQDRLSRRGIALSAALAALAVVDPPGRAAPPRLVENTWRQVRAFMSGGPLDDVAFARVAGLARLGLPFFGSGKPKRALAGLLFLVLTTGAGGILGSALTGEPPKPAASPEAENRELPKREEIKQAHTDRQGDPLPPGAIARLGTVRFRHGAMVASVAFSPDGKMVAAGGAGRTISLWDAATGKELCRFPPFDRGQPARVAFSPDGKMLASVSRANNLVCLYDVKTGKELRLLQGHQSAVTCLAFSPDGKFLASAESKGTVRIWDPTVKNQPPRPPGDPDDELRHISGDWGEVEALAFAPDSKSLAFAGKDGKFRLWNARTGDEMRRLDGHSQAIYALSFSPGGKLLASAGADKTIRLWATATGEQIRSLGEMLDLVLAVAFSPDGRLLASAHQDGTLALWDPHTGRSIRRWQGNAFVAASVAFSPDGKRLASGGVSGSAVRLWDVATGAELQASDAHRAAVELVRWMPDEKSLVSLDRENRILWWELATQRPRRQVVRPDRPGNAFALSADGKTLATASLSDQLTTIRLGEIGSDKPGRVLGKHQNAIHVMALSPDGRLLASGSRDEAIRLWDVEAGKQVHQFEGPGQIAGGLAFAPDGKALAYGTAKLGAAAGKIRLVDVKTGREIRAFDSQGWVRVLVFSPDGKVLASWHSGLPPDKPFVRLWDVTTGKELCRHNGHPGGNGTIAFSPDGKLVVSGEDGWDSGHTARAATAIHLWEAATGRLLRRFEGHHSGVRSLSFSPDGLKLASGGGDSTILVWDIPNRPHMAALTPPELDACWSALADADPAKAYDAVWSLVAAPERALPFLQKHLHPVPRRPDAKPIARLIADLDSDDFKVREKATRELTTLGDAAMPELRRALEKQPPLEMRRRIQQLLDQTSDWTPERLRDHRAIQTLEHMGTPAARTVLATLAAGAPGARRTEEARAALRRVTPR
jgi:RNA polymerase sigma factor (sigma-70 family)